MNDAPRYVTFADYLRVARERRALILLVAALFTGGAYAFARQQTPVYDAEASVQFESTNTQTSLFGQTIDPGGETPEQRAAANAATLTRPVVLRRARKLLGSRAPDEDLSELVDAQPEPRTQLVLVRASGHTGTEAARLANAVARAAVFVTRDETRRRFAEAARAQKRVLRNLGGGPGSEFFRLQQLDKIARFEELARVASPATVRREAVAPGSPAGPHIVRITIVGLLIGLTLGLVAAFVRDSLDRRFTTAREIAEDLQVPVLGSIRETILGSIPVERRGLKRLSHEDLEGFRIIRNNIEFLEMEEPPKVVLVTSAVPEEGKSTVSTALATTFAIAGKRTLLVEADLRRPTLARRLGLHSGPGLSDYLSGSTTPSDVLQTIDLPTASRNGRGAPPLPTGAFAAIVAGAPASHAVEILRSKRCFDFFEQIREVYDVVIVDTSPLLSVADTLELLPVADAIVLCVRASKTTRGQLHAAKSALAHFTQQPTAIVVTGLRARDESASYGYYGRDAAAR